MRSPHASTIYDNLRLPVGWNGAIKSPSPQDERAAASNSFYAGRDTSGIGQAATSSRSSRTFTGGSIAPQGFLNRQPAGFQDIAADAGKAMNARAALPNRGTTPLRQPGTGQQSTHRADRRRRSTPLAKRR